MKEHETKIQELADSIIREKEHWENIRDKGCNDPFWCDGTNMNLTRNHIIYNKSVIAEICSETGLSFPVEYYIPTPPEVDNCYMANLKQKERVVRLRQLGRIVTKKCPSYDDKQLSLF